MLVMLVVLVTGYTLRVASEILAYQDVKWAWNVLPISALIELTAVALFAPNRHVRSTSGGCDVSDDIDD
jgi:hypothetical protein